MLVADILRSKGRAVATAAPGSRVEDIARDLAEKGIGSLLIVEGDKVLGIVSERDIVLAIARDGASVLGEPVSKIMTRQVESCRESDTIASLMARMTEGKFRHLPVIENAGLVGIVSIGDIVKFRIAEAEDEARAMRDYIASA